MQFNVVEETEGVQVLALRGLPCPAAFGAEIDRSRGDHSKLT